MRLKLEVKDPWAVLEDCLDFAAERACNRADKYNNEQLTDGQREMLKEYFVESFWLALDDRGLTLSPEDKCAS